MFISISVIIIIIIIVIHITIILILIITILLLLLLIIIIGCGRGGVEPDPGLQRPGPDSGSSPGPFGWAAKGVPIEGSPSERSAGLLEGDPPIGTPLAALPILVCMLAPLWIWSPLVKQLLVDILSLLLVFSVLVQIPLVSDIMGPLLVWIPLVQHMLVTHLLVELPGALVLPRVVHLVARLAWLPLEAPPPHWRQHI